jgi:hypothetical protein
VSGLALRRAAALRAEVARLESLTHHDAASFEADRRVGALLLDSSGHVLVERVAAPSGRAGRSGGSGIGPWSTPLPEGHPLRSERSNLHRREFEASLVRDRLRGPVVEDIP